MGAEQIPCGCGYLIDPTNTWPDGSCLICCYPPGFDPAAGVPLRCAECGEAVADYVRPYRLDDVSQPDVTTAKVLCYPLCHTPYVHRDRTVW